MSIQYLKKLKWSDWTRDERFFCSVLYSHAIKEPKDFAKWIVQEAGLNIPCDCDWDLGYEVCFYRDYLWHQGESAKQKDLPFKRTFDLCLFSNETIIIIEAKVCSGFTTKQNEYFVEDQEKIQKMPELEDIDVQIVALASSKYFASCQSKTLDFFKGKKISWRNLAEKYKDDLFVHADEMYKLKQEDIFKTV